MTASMLAGKRILVTQAGEFMGPVLCEVLAAHGAIVVKSAVALDDPAAPAREVAAAGTVDVLVANLAVPAPSTEVQVATDDEWRHTFAHNVGGGVEVTGIVAEAPHGEQHRAEHGGDGQQQQDETLMLLLHGRLPNASASRSARRIARHDQKVIASVPSIPIA